MLQESSAKPDVVILGAATVSCINKGLASACTFHDGQKTRIRLSHVNPDLISWSHLLQWSIKLHSGSSETLQQYKVNLTAIAVHLERLAERGEVYWVLQGKIGLWSRTPDGSFSWPCPYLAETCVYSVLLSFVPLLISASQRQQHIWSFKTETMFMFIYIYSWEQ